MSKDDEPKPFKIKRRANGSARYLNKRQEREWRGKHDRAGNQTYISLRGR